MARVEVWLVGNSMVAVLDRWKVRGGRFIDDGDVTLQLETTRGVAIGAPIDLPYVGPSGKYQATAPADIAVTANTRVIAHITGSAPEGELDIREPVNVRVRTA